MFKFKVGDQVQVASGSHKAKTGPIEKILIAENKVVVANVNIYKRHRKVTAKQPAGIFEIARPIDVSKIFLICPKCKKPTRIGFKLQAETKVRVCKKCHQEIT